jgi:hypothetical protein
MIHLHQTLADKIAKKLDKDTVYRIKDFPKMMAQADIAVMHSRDNQEIINILQDMGYKIVESKIMSFDMFKLNEKENVKFTNYSQKELTDMLKSGQAKKIPLKEFFKGPVKIPYVGLMIKLNNGYTGVIVDVLKRNNDYLFDLYMTLDGHIENNLSWNRDYKTAYGDKITGFSPFGVNGKPNDRHAQEILPEILKAEDALGIEMGIAKDENLYENFKPKKIEGREEEAEKFGIFNYIKLAKENKLKNLDYDEVEYDYIIDYAADLTDSRRVILYTDYEKSTEDITMLLISFMKHTFDKNGKYYECNIKKGPYILQIEDDNGNINREQFKTFEDGHKFIKKYFTEIFDVYKGLNTIDDNF